MLPPFVRTLEKANGKVYIDPVGSKLNTEIMPAGGITSSGKWIPLSLNEDGTLPSPSVMAGIPYYDDAQEPTDPGVEQLLISATVPVGVTRYISSVIVKTRVTGSFEILAGAQVIGSGRTGPGGSPTMNFTPARPLSAGVEYKVNFTSRPNSPVQSVECYLQADDITTS